MTIEVSQFVLHRNPDAPHVVAFASVTLGGSVALHGIRLVQGQDGFFLSMPNRRRPDGTHVDHYHPTTLAFRKKLTDALIAEHDRVLTREKTQSGSRP